MKATLKVLHAIPGISPLYGGPPRAVLQMCGELKRHGVQADVVTTDADGEGTLRVPLGKPTQIDGVTVTCFHSPFFRKYGFSWSIFQWLRSHLKAYDLLHLHAFFSYFTGPCVTWATRMKVPYIVRPSGELDPWCLKKGAFKKTLFLSLVGKRCLTRASAVHFTSEEEEAAAKRLSVPMRSVVVPLGTAVHPGDQLPPRGIFRERYPQLSGKKVILFLSRLDPKKGLDRLLAAVKDLSGQRNDFVLVVAGSGEPNFERELKNWVSGNGLREKAIFVGFLQGKDKQAAFRDADLFALPSYDENFGLAVVEAMGMGLPVVISDRVGVHPEVTRYHAGMVTSGHPAQLALCLRRLLEDASLCQRLAEGARRLVREKFTWEKIAAQMTALYRSMVSKS